MEHQQHRAQQHLGHHYLIDYYGCSADILNDLSTIQSILEDAVVESGTHKLNASFHEFVPQGVTGVILLEESHLSIHTWPENEFAAVDFFTCGDISKMNTVFETLGRALKAKDIKSQEIKRGFIKRI